MKIPLASPRFIGVILLVCTAEAFAVSGFRPAPRGGLPLGTSTLCTRYSGLPPGWGQDRKAGMILLHGGEFILGTTLGYDEERPEVKTRVDGFWIDQTEVTVAQFASFVKATGYITTAEKDGHAAVFQNPSAGESNQRSYAWWKVIPGADWRHPHGPGSSALDNQPVTLVTLEDAEAYAHWLGHELPGEAQWEFAAKAGQRGSIQEKEPRNARGRPIANFWQGHFPVTNTGEDGYTGLAPVGCYPGNPFQLYDMRGNAWEQTKDLYTGSHEPGAFPARLDSSSTQPNRLMVIKGGSHLCGRDFCVRYRASAREAHEANLPFSHIGFRTILVE